MWRQFRIKKPKYTSGTVYELNCNESTKIYTGETRRKWIERIKEHKNDGDKDKKKENITGLSQHVKDTRHAAALESIKIIIYENNSKKKQV